MAIAATVFQMPRLQHQWLKHIHDRELHFAQATIKTGTYTIVVPRSGGHTGGFSFTTVSATAKLPTGTVLGKITKGAATAAAKAGGNTGNGVFTIDATTPTLAGAKVGVYTVRCIEAASNSGTFRVEDPDGFVIGDVAVGATFSDGIKFAIADGSADFIVGDGFDVTVPAGSGKLVPCKYDALDGSQDPFGVLFDGVDVTSEDVQGVVVTGFATIAPLELVWDSTFDNDTKKGIALTKLAAKHFVTAALI